MFDPARNPYDFQNAIARPALFAGRRQELEDACYYLDLAINGRPRSIAVVGERASGKTSFLNMVEVEARNRGIVVFPLDLDSSIASSRTRFFCELFESALHASCEAGLYEGLTGEVYQTFRALMDAWEVPDDLTWAPFNLPLQFARAASAGRAESFNIPWNALRHDFSLLSDSISDSGLSATILGIIDEATLLTTDRSILETLRNLIQRNQRLMLVLAGTRQLFPALRDVFSPTARQFKFIEMKPFGNRRDVRECVLNPLGDIGITEPDECIALRTLHELGELSGNRPYELQLVCHMMYRRASRVGSARMELNTDVLDDVFAELDNVRGTERRLIKQRLDALTENDLKVLCRCLRPADMPIEYVSGLRLALAAEEPDRSDLVREHRAMEAACGALLQQGLLDPDTGLDCRRFPGDELDDVYLKYYAETREVREYREPAATDEWCRLSILRAAHRHSVEPFGVRGVYATWPLADPEPFFRDVTEIGDRIREGRYEFRDRDDAPLIHLLATSSVFHQQASRPVGRLRVRGLPGQGHLTFLLVCDDGDAQHAIGKLQELRGAMEQRLALLDIVVDPLEILSEPVIPFCTLCGGIPASAGESALTLALHVHTPGLHDEGRMADLTACLDLLLRLDRDDVAGLNNLAYTHVLLGEPHLALEVAERAHELAEDALLVKYNLAIARLLTSGCDQARELLVAIAATCTQDDNHLAVAHCMVIAIPEGSAWRIAEIHGPPESSLPVPLVARLALALMDASPRALDAEALNEYIQAGPDALVDFCKRYLEAHGSPSVVS